ncbi:MAG: two-component system response regulator [Candidatus Riflebacteria bacterium GWC2_50_8]|nr:MAG: two-component system response regulator [Candidatus Riflebacteria bacterium GWC2_50_8]
MDMQTDLRSTVLVVDDTPDNLVLISVLLKKKYITKIATSGAKALEIANSDHPPDLILLDVMMPEMDGYEVLRRLKAEPATRDIPVIFLTAKADEDDEECGLELGAADYITKPINPSIVLLRVKNHILLKNSRDFLRDKNAYLEQEVVRRTHEVNIIKDVTIMAMASLAETRDNETGNHIRRTQFYVRELAVKLKTHPRFSEYLTDETIELLFKSAPLHDIGKVGIPDHILLKPGKFTPEEFEIMKRHTIIGRDAILAAEKRLSVSVSFLQVAREISCYHQEKWDGSGYPEGISGDAIPISARLMAVADVFDALISRRVYKPPFSKEKALQIMFEGRGKHFDPDILDAFMQIADSCWEIACRFVDSELDINVKAGLESMKY